MCRFPIQRIFKNLTLSIWMNATSKWPHERKPSQNFFIQHKQTLLDGFDIWRSTSEFTRIYYRLCSEPKVRLDTYKNEKIYTDKTVENFLSTFSFVDREKDENIWVGRFLVLCWVKVFLMSVSARFSKVFFVHSKTLFWSCFSKIQTEKLGIQTGIKVVWKKFWTVIDFIKKYIHFKSN